MRQKRREGPERREVRPSRRCSSGAWRPCTEITLESLHDVRFVLVLGALLSTTPYNKYKKSNSETRKLTTGLTTGQFWGAGFCC
jgi:hypothetical protein